MRQIEGRKRHATAGSIDRQTIRSSQSSDARGYDAGKKINGRKRHLWGDTLGLVLGVMVLPADRQDRAGARRWLAAYYAHGRRARVRQVGAAGGDAGARVAWVHKVWSGTLEIVRRTQPKGCHVLPRRWVVERTFGWLGRYRRLARDYERQAKTGKRWFIWP